MKILKEFGLTEPQLRKILSGNKRIPQVIKSQMTNKKFYFGVVSDTHLGSNFEKLDELHTFYSICKKMRIKNILHAGDIVAGQGIYRGQENEIHTFGATKQADYVIKKYPFIKGIKTYFITGNHCLAYWRQNGVDIGKLISEKRKDMLYLGQYQGDVFLNGIKIRLIHPDGAGAYAISYKLQKIAEQIPSGEKPQVLIAGHYHTSLYFFYRNMHLLQAGAFEGQNSYLLRKGINPSIGGWTVEVRISGDKKGSLVAFVPCWIPFFS
jgi:predicted phosphodiesterase